MSDVQPADFATADYRTVLARLTTLDAEAAAERAEAQQWRDGRIEATDRAVAEADQAIRDTRRAVTTAQRELEEVDARAAGLWSEYVHKVGPVAERYGRTVPAAAIPHQRERRGATDYLDEVATKVKYTAPARPITLSIKVLFGVFGFVSGVAGVAAYQVLRAAGGDAARSTPTGTWRDAMPVVALVALLACPVLAVVGAKRTADRRGTALDATMIAIVLGTGLVTAGLLVAAVRSAGAAG